ncbi:MAG: hypothetical protein AAFO94_08535, partial [Bacteroidota bacterium]
KQQIGEKTKPTVSDRLFAISRAVGGSTYGPTATAKQSLALVNQEMAKMKTLLKQYDKKMESLIESLKQAGAPRIEGLSY